MILKKYILIPALIVAFAGPLYGQAEPPYGMNEFDAYSLFRGYYSTGEYEAAIEFGSWMLESQPREIEGVETFSLEREFNRFIDIYSSWAGEERDPAVQEELLVEGLAIFDLAFDTFSEEEMDQFLWIRNKGRFYQQHSNVLPDALDMAFTYYEEAYEMDHERFARMEDSYYVIRLLDYHVSQGNKERAFEIIEEIEHIESATLQNAISQAQDQLYSDPAERIEYLLSRLDEADNEEEMEGLLTELRDLYETTGDNEEALTYTRRLYELNPNFENTHALAINASDNADYQTALPLLEESLEKAPSDDEKREIILEIIETQRNLENYQSARSVARSAIGDYPGWGQIYIQMADIYTSVIRQCASDGMSYEDRSVYWLVLDYLRKAAETDASLQRLTTQRIQSLAAYVPTVEDIFQKSDIGLEIVGEPYQIDESLGACYAWIDETTTVQRPPE